MQPIYRHKFTIREDVIDENGHVNNVVYVQWMQDIAVAHSNALGCTSMTRDVGATWVVRSHKVEYLSPAFAGEEVEALTWVVNFRKVRSLRRYKFVRIRDNTVLARGETDWVLVDAETGRPRIIPEDVRGAFQLLTEDQEP
ncbi:MAG TPA: thioesterase family protein [Thermodesulfobacteriota bacterium]|jgi:acyl-CoA thioester hydrolase|nr:thioesterase family protein [Thermodesulfobacteriota bacterium]